MKKQHRAGRPRTVFAALAVIVAMFGLSAGTASASVVQPGHSATQSYTGQGSPRTAAYTVSMARGDLTVAAPSTADTPMTNSASTKPAGPKCHWGGWKFWKTWCGWKFTHSQTMAIYHGSKAVAVAYCTAILKHYHYVGEKEAIGACTFIVQWVEIHHSTSPGKNQCLEVQLHGPVPTVNYAKC